MTCFPQVVATDVNADALASLHAEAPDIRPEVMDVSKYEDVEMVVPGVRPVSNKQAMRSTCAWPQAVLGAAWCRPDWDRS